MNLLSDESKGTQLVAIVLPSNTVLLELEHCETIHSKTVSDLEKTIYELWQNSPSTAFLTLGLLEHSFRFAPSIEYFRELSSRFCHDVQLEPDFESSRGDIELPLDKDFCEIQLKNIPPITGSERITVDTLLAYWKLLHAGLKELLDAAPDKPAALLLEEAAPGRRGLSHKVHFHLVENKRDSESPFAFLATYATLSEDGTQFQHQPLSVALDTYGQETKRLVSLLSAIYKAAAKSVFIRNLVDSGEIFHPLRLKPVEAFKFLKEVELYEDAGILCRIPRWWSSKPRKIGLSISLGDKRENLLGINSLLSCSPVFELDGEPMSMDEVQKILLHHEGLALVKGRWMVVEKEALAKQLEFFKEALKKGKETSVSFAEAMQILMGLKAAPFESAIDEAPQLIAGSWLKTILEKLNNPMLAESIKVPSTLKATLRPYQQHGLNWLAFLEKLEMGSCLADDMGLGKTIQVLALLLYLKERKAPSYGCSLLVVPASLIGNWLSEIDRFAPSLRAGVAHSGFSDPDTINKLSKSVTDLDLVILTYSGASRYKWVLDHNWYYVILDEAQAIKNPGSSQTRIVKEITSARKLVMTGTPVENRLGDLWSLFDFVNKGLLGNATAFKGFVRSLESKPDRYGKLRQVIKPYLLRRLKTDKTIISDLPDKVEMKVWITLSKEQTILYRKLTEKLLCEVQNIEGIKRKGIILTYLMKFKQVCNHPDQYSGGSAFSADNSGKFSQLSEICETIREKREKVIVFTQFREMIAPLERHLTSVFGCKGLHLHGGTPPSARKELVNRFQDPENYIPFFILSLKAGGTGLNLTQADHVVHFDRWWNPAVERQAEDRAYRIGRKKNVMVHAFVCKGTIEERIDDLIQSKKELSEKVLSQDGESILTEMDNTKLKEMFTLTLTE
jgi:non-specific serine/threonine protein kinase